MKILDYVIQNSFSEKNTFRIIQSIFFFQIQKRLLD